jgi:hypothetical protein
MLQVRFDRVFGNPPWGGVLKGPLAPVYDTSKKERFAREYPSAAKGKYDIYGLFMERALQILKPGGRVGLVTQGTFVDKEWAAGLRMLLASRCHLRYLVDLNPFGQLFFHAMNIPCITVADLQDKVDGKEECIAILSRHPDNLQGLSEGERRKLVASTVQEAIGEISSGSRSVTIGFARGARIPIQRRKKTANDRWNLAASDKKTSFPREWFSAADILEPFQGVTIGGVGCLEFVLMDKDQARILGLEADLIHSVIKGLEITKWEVLDVGSVILYPYTVKDDEAQPAFSLKGRRGMDEKTRVVLRQLGINDSLDFDQLIDEREQEIARRKGVNRSTVNELLGNRVRLGLVSYQKTATYLVQHYELLEGRIFKKRNIRSFNREWYEFIWPRDPKAMMGKPKIVSPRLTKEVRFALDAIGIVPQDSCVCMIATGKTRKAPINYVSSSR